MPKLKVFRTTSGFHDAYVAAPSRAAALEAWGANTDLFAMGAAELVTDAKLMAKPLANPGTVIRRSRGTADDHLSAAGPAKRRAVKKDSKPSRSSKAKPPPSRASLDQADRALAKAETDFEIARSELEKEARLLQDKRRKLERHHQAKIENYRLKRDRAEAEYKDAVKAWRES